MIVHAPSIAQILVAPLMVLAVVLALGVVLFAVADAAGRRRSRETAQAAERDRVRRREHGLASWERS